MVNPSLNCISADFLKANLFYNNDNMHPAQRSKPVMVFGRMWCVFRLLFLTLRRSCLSPTCSDQC
ncbi:uncharacterized protein LACBIDRAFT_303268 [Laccaria bicolor S238N-H82]|uniref:Predicted protein n=1 Tax=Laccaria bicolor (strain S238N-H82 / ATCC MYA-4686) TaxID=486041 RepID=B0DJ87_LACBS|nr:uncharacterized protein LACBIDRAFT_303268 [Laccaria bicolor S238N-H82]EDR05362.1 predicted protein [Laccaria bicolor S238N-H82]|eukprot:XP_001883920.1 predicted protein [Laccaria bicolor S238N-H82]